MASYFLPEGVDEASLHRYLKTTGSARFLRLSNQVPSGARVEADDQTLTLFSSRTVSTSSKAALDPSEWQACRFGGCPAPILVPNNLLPYFNALAPFVVGVAVELTGWVQHLDVYDATPREVHMACGKVTEAIDVL